MRGGLRRWAEGPAAQARRVGAVPGTTSKGPGDVAGLKAGGAKARRAKGDVLAEAELFWWRGQQGGKLGIQVSRACSGSAKGTGAARRPEAARSWCRCSDGEVAGGGCFRVGRLGGMGDEGVWVAAESGAVLGAGKAELAGVEWDSGWDDVGVRNGGGDGTKMVVMRGHDEV